MVKKHASRPAPAPANTVPGGSPLAFALDFEVKGATLYLKQAVESRNPLTKQLFYSLAMEEIAHAKRIDDIYSGIGWQTAAAPSLPPVETTLKDLFTRAGKDTLKKDTSHLEGYTLAMEMEKNGFKAYSDFYNRAVTVEEKEFFKELVKEEKEHLDALANVYSYLTDVEDWLQDEESRVWNWMNL